MPVYHQMGHQSHNLLSERDLQTYAGAILSPVNDDKQAIIDIIEQFRDRDFETIFDPQLYYPRTEKEKLRTWGYFPDDYATTDFSMATGWRPLVNSLTRLLLEIRPDAVCSPAVVPRMYSDEYFDLTTQIAEMLCQTTSALSISVLQTVLVDMSILADYRRVMSIASIITKTKATRFYLVFLANSNNPRRELEETEEIKGAMALISELVQNGLEILVGFCSSDIILWKTAGASSCATGKFWNLRRFDPQRWGEPPEGGGGQLAYWFEEALMTFLRESDIFRTGSWISSASLNNPYYAEVQRCINTGEAWVGLGWRQFLYWFADIEGRLSRNEVSARQLLREADKAWEDVEDNSIIMEERRNDGRWIRPWLRAVIEYQSSW